MRSSHDNFSTVELRTSQAMITPESPLLTTLIHISPSHWTISKQNGNCPLDFDFKSNVLYKSIASKNIQSYIN